MRLHDPVWLYALMALPLLGVVSWWGVKKGSEVFGRFVSARISPKLIPGGLDTRRSIRIVVLTLSAALILIALSRPQYGVKPMRVKRAGIDLIIALDTSKSMSARDVKPSRIERARNETIRLVSSLAGNRIGLIAFAGDSFIECPLTLDMGAVRMILDTINVGAIPSPGTAIAEAIYDSIKAFKTSKAKTKALILITDGESLSGDIKTSAKAAKKAGLKIFPIGIGSTAGAPIPMFDENGGITGYKKDNNGKLILTHLDVGALKTIADATGGQFFVSQGESLDLSKLVKSLQGMEKTDITSLEFTEYEERYQPVILVALLLLTAEYILSTARIGGIKPHGLTGDDVTDKDTE